MSDEINFPIKRYWVFAYSDHWPRGGMKDRVGSYSTIEEAISRAKKCGGDVDIIDVLTEQVCDRNGRNWEKHEDTCDGKFGP